MVLDRSASQAAALSGDGGPPDAWDSVNVPPGRSGRTSSEVVDEKYGGSEKFEPDKQPEMTNLPWMLVRGHW